MSDKPIDWSAGNGMNDEVVEKVKTHKNRAVRWVKEHDTEILAATTIVLAIKYRRVKQQQAKTIKTVKELTKNLDDARVKLEASNLFDYYFGYPRR